MPPQGKKRRAPQGFYGGIYAFFSACKIGQFTPGGFLKKGRTWAIAVRRGSYKSLFLPNSGRFSLEK